MSVQLIFIKACLMSCVVECILNVKIYYFHTLVKTYNLHIICIQIMLFECILYVTICSVMQLKY